MAFETEAELRGLTVAELAEHAALLFVAEIDSRKPAGPLAGQRALDLD